MKVSIIGAGHVGATVAYATFLTCKGVDLRLIDVNIDLANATALDISHASMLDNSFIDEKCTCKVGTYEDLNDSDFLVITAGLSQSAANGGTRSTGINKSYAIIKNICDNINKTRFKGYVIVASNPNDVMSYAVYRLCHIPKERIIGTGTSLDSLRLNYILSEELEVDSTCITSVLPSKEGDDRICHMAYVIGEHGETSVPVYSLTNIVRRDLQGEYDTYLEDYLAEYGVNIKEFENRVTGKVRRAGYDVLIGQGATYYAIANIISCIISNYDIALEEGLDDIKDFYPGPLSRLYTLKDGHEIFVSLPRVIDEEDMELVYDALSEEEKEMFDISCRAIEGQIEGLGLYGEDQI